MERLTIPDQKIEGGMRRAAIDTRAVKENAMNLYWALKKYEDTGLTPEEVREIDKAFSAQAKELAEYKKAEEEGLLIRIPVAKGDRIWEIIDDGVEKAYIQGIEVQEISDSRIWANDACFDYDDIGRIVFLLREEAEAKMTETGKQPDTGWIPVEERMPEENAAYYLVTTLRSPKIEMAWYMGHEWYWNNSITKMAGVLAWMPLPEPYHPDRCHECFGAADAECGRCEDE